MYLEELKCKKLDSLMEFNKIQDIRKKDVELTKNTPRYNLILLSLIYLLLALNVEIDIPILLISVPITYAVSIPCVNKLIKSINHLSHGYTTSEMIKKERELILEVNKCNDEIKYINRKRDSIKSVNTINNDNINLNKSKKRVLKRVK